MYREVLEQLKRNPEQSKRMLESLQKRQAFSRPDRLRMIILALLVQLEKGEEWVTLPQVAKMLHVTASTALRGMMRELETDGQLETCTQPYPGIAGKRVWYRLNPEARKEARRKATKRTVTVNHRKQSTTMELPLSWEDLDLPF